MKKERAVLILVLLITIIFAVALYYTFKPRECMTPQCFQEHMASCARASYINEEPEASWKYVIKRQIREECEIEVTLLQAKVGDLNLRDFEGHTMLCTYPLGRVGYPDKDMSLCHGLLKEDLQGLIIQKLHKYLINNLDDIRAALGNSTIV